MGAGHLLCVSKCFAYRNEINVSGDGPFKFVTRTVAVNNHFSYIEIDDENLI